MANRGCVPRVQLKLPTETNVIQFPWRFAVQLQVFVYQNNYFILFSGFGLKYFRLSTLTTGEFIQVDMPQHGKLIDKILWRMTKYYYGNETRYFPTTLKTTVQCNICEDA